MVARGRLTAPLPEQVFSVPPQSIEAEEAVLGAVLVDPATIDLLADLAPVEFYRESHAMVWRAMRSLSGRGVPPDLLSVTLELDRTGELETVGGRSFLGSLSSSPVYAESYAEVVRQKALLRGLIGAAGRISAVAYEEPADPQEAVDRAEAALFEISRRAIASTVEPIEVLVDRAVEHLQQLATYGAFPGLRTGLDDLDRLTGGLAKGDLILLAARPSIGKTSLALNIAEQQAVHTHSSVAFFSLEMSKHQLMLRLLSSVTGIDGRMLREEGAMAELLEMVGVELDSLKRAKFFIHDKPGATATEIRTISRRLAGEHGLDLVIVDYIQLMTSMTKAESRNNEMSLISQNLKNLARELDVPVLALSQLSRGVEARDSMEPRLSDLRDSGALEQDADLVMFLWKERSTQEYVGPEPVQLKVAKARNGPTGEVELFFDKKHTRFMNA